MTDADYGHVEVPAFTYATKKVHHEPYAKISPLRPELSVRGKNIVVTGGGTGIGKATAIAFVQAGAGSVSILGRREDRLKGAVAEMKAAATYAGTICHYESADLVKHEHVARAFKSIASKVGNLDILVSNAGGLQPVKPILGYDVDEFMEGFEINVRSAFNAIQAFIPLANPEPIVIDISSAIAHIPPMAGLSVHGASKAAAAKMITYFAAENPAIHFVSIQPGSVRTELAARVGAQGQDAPELPGQFCVWLASSEAKFLKNKYVWANWDAEELEARADEIQKSRLFTIVLEGSPV